MHEHHNGRASWGMPSPGEILLRIEGRIGGLERASDMVRNEMRDGLQRIERKTDHSHARITRVEASVAHLQSSALASSL